MRKHRGRRREKEGEKGQKSIGHFQTGVHKEVVGRWVRGAAVTLQQGQGFQVISITAIGVEESLEWSGQVLMHAIVTVRSSNSYRERIYASYLRMHVLERGRECDGCMIYFKPDKAVRLLCL